MNIARNDPPASVCRKAIKSAIAATFSGTPEIKSAKKTALASNITLFRDTLKTTGPFV